MQVGSAQDLWQPAVFANASGGVISLATPVQFAVPSQGALNPTVINRVDIVTLVVVQHQPITDFTYQFRR